MTNPVSVRLIKDTCVLAMAHKTATSKMKYNAAIVHATNVHSTGWVTYDQALAYVRTIGGSNLDLN